MTPNPVLLKLGPVTVYWYGFLIMTGVGLAAYIAARLSRDDGQDPEHVWNALMLCLVFGILGARLYHVIDLWDYYSQHPNQILSFHMQGFGIYGAVLGGMLGMFIYTSLKKLSFLQWADYAFVGVPLAQALGRWGNFFNQELYGYPTDLPWGIYIEPAHRLPGFEQYERFHPTFLYESIWNLLSFIVLWVVARRYKKQLLRGDIACLYGMLYPLGRFFVEFQRPDAWTIGGIPTAQIVAVVAFLFCGAIIVYRHFIAKQKPVIEGPFDGSAEEELAE